MTKPRYQSGCADRSQVRGDAGVPAAFWQVNGNNGNLNNDNRNNQAFARPCRFVARASECRGEEVTVRALYDAWRAARRNKKPSLDQLDFELHLIDNLLELAEALNAGTWHPKPATCFVATRPKARQIHAPAFSDRVVHHLTVPPLIRVYEPLFIHDSYANRVGKGTHAAVRRVQQFVRQVNNGQGHGWSLKLDIHNFFYSIHRDILWRDLLKPRLLRAGVSPVVLQVTYALLCHHVEHYGVIHRATAAERAFVPPHKRLENAAPNCGLPIGNLPSQFFSNVYMNPLDQFVKHVLKCRRYVRYVDDFVLVHRDRAVLAFWLDQIQQFLADKLKLRLKDDIRLQPLSTGIDFLGYVIYPAHTRVRPRVLRHASESLRGWHDEHAIKRGFSATPADVRKLGSVLASYDGHLRHANAWRIRQRLLAAHPWTARFAGRRRFHHRLEGRHLLFRYRHGRAR